MNHEVSVVRRVENRIKDTFHKVKKWEALIFFVVGFCFDAFLLHRIDDPLMLVHQAIYLSLSALIIAWDLFVEIGYCSVPKWLAKPWEYREGILHFLLGTLLNVYTIFYFKSGTFLSSIIFLMILAFLLYLNEARPTRISKHILRNALFALCLVSYMNIVVSKALGAIGVWVFFAAIIAATVIHFGIHSGFVYFLKVRLDSARVLREIRLPFVVVALVYTLLYVAKILPPVPLSLKYIGIYHEVTKQDGSYRLGYEKSSWYFWERGNQTFRAKPSDKIYCFIQIFSPTRFKDQLFVRWSYQDPRLGWVSADAIPLDIVGGRSDGYRGFTSKSNYQPGRWRVSVETSDGREIGRIKVDVELDSSPDPERALAYEIR